jgi:uncharacterized protein (TIGR00251 family)
MLAKILLLLTSLQLEVIPNAKKTQVIQYDALANVAILWVKAPALHNKANDAIVGYFSKYFGRSVRVLGKNSAKKILLISFP